MRQDSPDRLQRQAIVFCLLTGAIWGFGFIATSQSLSAFGAFQVLLIRFAGAAALAWIPVLTNRKSITRQSLTRGVVCGLFLFGAFALQTLGLDLTEAGSNAFFTSANVVLVPFLAWAVFRKPPALRQFGACLLCFAGIGLPGLRPAVCLSYREPAMGCRTGSGCDQCHTDERGCTAFGCAWTLCKVACPSRASAGAFPGVSHRGQYVACILAADKGTGTPGGLKGESAAGNREPVGQPVCSHFPEGETVACHGCGRPSDPDGGVSDRTACLCPEEGFHDGAFFRDSDRRTITGPGDRCHQIVGNFTQVLSCVTFCGTVK